MLKFKKNLIIVLFLVLASLVLANFVFAQGVDVGLEYGEQIGLSDVDPRLMIANVIRIVLGFLGIIVVGLIIYAGWLYMTAGGEEEKIEKAKKILIGAIVGLVIILSAFAIATFILNKLMSATFDRPVGPVDEDCDPPCQTWQYCCQGLCQNTPCGGGGGDDDEEVISCDKVEGGVCDADATLCKEGYRCNISSCTCEAGGGYESSCDSAPDTVSCEADNNLCSAYLNCDGIVCTCLGAPVIEWVSPVDDSDTPNGAVGDLITIGGRYFGDTAGKVYFWDGKEASLPIAPCDNSWQNNQIVVLVPAGAANGPIKVVRADSQEDTTGNDRGPVINDFVINSTKRPGICKLDPDKGMMNGVINYYGLGLLGGMAYFGDQTTNVVALNSNFNANTQGTAKVPNLKTGQTTTFVSKDGVFSNYLKFKKEPEPYTGPAITSFEPTQGAPGQYVTIYGRGFGKIRGVSKVYFGSGPLREASYEFPKVCAESVWGDNQVIVKVPDSAKDGIITMEIGSQKIVSKDSFKVNNNLPLVPGLCKIAPIIGQNNTPISLWGENFGAFDSAKSKVRFNLNKDQSGAALINFWDIDNSASGLKPDKITTTIHQQAITGPVQVVKDTLVSNGFNFTVGSCVKNDDCGSEICCPADSAEAGRCKVKLDECYVRIKSSVYEWNFTTGFGGGEDEGNIIISILDKESSEMGETAKFTIKLKDRPKNNVAVDLASADASEGEITDPPTKRLTFTSSNYNSEQTVIVTGQDDSVPDGATVYYINLKTISGDVDYNNKEKSVELINRDDEIDGGVLITKENGKTSESGETEKIKVKLYEVPETGENVSIAFVSSDLTEAIINNNSTLIFSDKNYDAAQTIIVAGVDDTIKDGDIKYETTLTVDSQSKNYKGMTPDSIKLVNLDNDLGGDRPGEPGEKCVATTTPLTCDSSYCGGEYYSCRVSKVDVCGICCCDPQIPQFNENGLRCLANQSPCDGSDRGLYCGCQKNQDCGVSGDVGCASDTCCRQRPYVSSVFPADNAAGVCRNSLISATFNEKMNISSFVGNMIVVGDYGSGVCPPDTQYLTLDKGNSSEKNIFVEIYNRTLRTSDKMTNFLFGDQVLAGSPNPKNNYCAITGIVNGVDNADKTTTLVFSPVKALEKGITYYAIIKGDESLDNSRGVLNSWGIGMNGPDTKTLNSKEYAKIKIWSFTAGNDICHLERVAIKPSSYLFKIAGTRQSFYAQALSSDGQGISPILGVYNWEWNWGSDDNTIAEVSNSNNSIQTVTSKNIKDGKTYIKVTATVTEDNFSTDRPSKTGQAEVYVFLCENPWPPVQNNGNWSPWNDKANNCTPGLAGDGCGYSYNYGLYYCRDAGATGPVDDLPAILSENTIVRGKSNTQNILKEAYFFRETLPDISKVNLQVAGVPPEGKAITLSWSSISVPVAETLVGYKIYYGTASGQYRDQVDVGKKTSYTINGLFNNQTYYFSIIAQYASGAVSGYSKEVSAAPKDTIAPAKPKMILTPGDGKMTISWVDNSNGEAVSFRIYYKATSDCGVKTNFGASQVAINSPVVVSNLDNNTKYCFGLVAYDLDGNASALVTGSSSPSSPVNTSL